MTEDARIHRFEEFELTERPAALRRDGVPVPLPAQPLRLLRHLVERPGQLVGHDEIHSLLWAGQDIDVTSRMHTCVRQIRKALGDAGEEVRFVETVPRSGYRFVAQVRSEAASPASDGTKRTPRTFGAGLALGLAVAVVVLGALSGLLPPSAETTGPDAPADPVAAFREAEHLLATDPSPGATRRALELLRGALTHDAEAAPIHAALSATHARLAEPLEARHHAEQAVSLDPGYARGLLRLAEVQGWLDGDWTLAGETLGRAAALTPTATDVLVARSGATFFRGERDDALRMLEDGIGTTEAPAVLLTALGTLRSYDWDLTAARGDCEAALEHAAELRAAQRCLLHIAVAARDWPTAAARAHTLEGTDPGGAAADPEAAVLAWAERERARLLAADAGAVALAEPTIIARRYDEALLLLREAARAGDPALAHALFDPVFVPLHHIGAFLALRAELGLVTPED